jgi:ribosomal protein S18 acetylase RimI-like enzyme
MDVNIKGVVELDKINMSRIIARSGDKFCPETRENDLIEEISDGVKFVEYCNNRGLVGYIQYDFLGNGYCFILSLQVHPKYRKGAVLKSLFKSFAEELNKEKPKALISSVHKSNPASILLHKRLLFEIDRETDQRFEFILKGENLLKLIDRFYKPGHCDAHTRMF